MYVARIALAALAVALGLLVFSGQASAAYLMLPPAIYAALRVSQASLLASQAALEAKVAERTADLARTRMRLVEAQELAQIGSWEWDVRADAVTWSQELYRIFGIDPAGHTATFAGHLERVHPDDRERLQEEIRAILAARETFGFDERIVRPDGTVRVLASRGQVHRDDAGEPLRLVGVCQDVTDSRRAERALRASEERARLIIDAASDAFIASDERDVITEWNRQAEELFGWTRAEAIGRRVADLVVAPHNRERHRAAVAAYMQTGEGPWVGTRMQRDGRHRDGREFPVELTVSAVQTDDGTSFNTFLHDISERVRGEQYLATEHAVARVLLESHTLQEARPRVLEAFGTGLGWAVGAWWEVDEDDETIRCARFWRGDGGAAGAFERATMQAALAPGVGLPGRVWETGATHVLPDVPSDANFPRRATAAQAGLSAGIAAPLTVRGRTAAVIEFYATEHLHLGDELGEMMARLCERVAQFVERMAAERDLREAEERFHRAFADAGTGMALIGVRGEEAGRFLEVNDALCSILRSERDDLLGAAIADMTHPDDVVGTLDLVQRLVEGEIDVVHSEGRLIAAGAEVVWISFSTSLVRDAAGEPLYRISQLQDITERKRFEGQLQHLADHDPVTGLFNRRRFDEELTRELASARRYRTGGAVLALDLDNFKYINDTLGHRAGDELIVSVAAVLRGRLRGSDTVARLGGDEFAVVLPHVDERQARRVAEDLLEAIRREAIVSTAEGARRTTASVGIALFAAQPAGLSSEELLVEADIAMYDAKEAGRDQACLFDADSSRQLSLQARMTWVEEIREALDEERFTLFAQPIVSLAGASTRHELLVRMVGRDGDIIPPGAFLPVAERFDLVQDIDRWVVGRAIELLGEHERRGDDVCFSVNLSAKSLGNADLPAQIARQLAAHGADPSRLIFEITETAAIVNLDRAKQFARRLHELGCGFALDDFGAGFASFYYLKHLPFDLLKIDGEFVESLADSATNQLVVQSLVTIARGLGKQTIAEYVGDERTLEMLRDYGVDFAQGFHVGRPVPVAAIEVPRSADGVPGG